MVQRSPCEYFLRYLLVHPAKYTPEKIREQVLGLGLDYLGARALEQLRKEMGAIPVPFLPSDPDHAPSMRFLSANKIYRLFWRSEAVEGAFAIFDVPRARELVETGLISRMTPRQLSTIVRANGFAISSDAIEAYAFYFFNMALVDTTELRTLMIARGIPAADKVTDPDELRILEAQGLSSKRDARRNATFTRSPQVAQIMFLLQQGIVPARVQLDKLLDTARIAAATQVMEEISSQSPGSAIRAKDLSLTAATLQSMLLEVGNPDLDLQQELRAVTLKNAAEQVPIMVELVGDGTVTTQMLRAPDDFEQHDAGASDEEPLGLEELEDT